MKKVLLISLTLSLCISALAQTRGRDTNDIPDAAPDKSTPVEYVPITHNTLNDETLMAYHKAVPVEPRNGEQDTGSASTGSGLFPNNTDAAYTQRVAVAFRTNLLVPLLNVGLEVPMGRRFSVAADIYYPWLGYDKKNANCLQAALADVQLRWWLRPRAIDGLRGNTLTGSSISLGCYAGLYDFERNSKGLQGEIYGAYIDYGYTFYLARHFRLTLNAGVGTARIPYRTYTVYSEGGRLIKDRLSDNIKMWYGPVHAGVVLSIPITGGKRYEKDNQ